ncbi:Tetratricopeptide-like helical domain containing protein [Trema orientale]|uniref:Tetratricopeptide-like helical domain containing protein n=1 Tax=Trema orientale TaxID=63057 RepID=A0A2P5EWT5_TREOI|nr:Tetratricopeptide-like helical domain containing protein [Trema orientale]
MQGVGNIVDSYTLFEGLIDPSLVSCNAIVAGFVYNELFEEAISLFNRFRKFGLIPDVATALTLIQGSVAFGWKSLCESIHGLLVKFDLISDTSVGNAVLDMYSNLMDLKAANKIFDRMEGKDIISWTTMMGFLVRLDNASDAIELFGKMGDGGVSSDVVVFMNLCSACAILGDLEKVKQTHAQAIISGFGSELVFINSLISMCSKFGDLLSSRTGFHQTTWKSLVSYTAMISAYLQNGCPGEAFNLWTKVRLEENFCLDSIMLIIGLTGSGELAALELCLQLHCYAFQLGFPRYRSVQNSLISTYSKCGIMELAQKVFEELSDLLDIVSWNAILYGCGINGCGETALALYHEMRNGGEAPDSATYLGILNACSRSGLVDSDASESASKLLDATGPNARRALLSGCLLHSNVDLAEYAATRLFEQEPEQCGLTVLLSNIYASVGRFQDAEALRPEGEWSDKESRD